MEPELFSASPRAAQMAGARLGLAHGAFGSSYSSLLATVPLCLSLSLFLSGKKQNIMAQGRKSLPYIFPRRSRFSGLTSVSLIGRMQMCDSLLLGWNANGALHHRPLHALAVTRGEHNWTL